MIVGANHADPRIARRAVCRCTGSVHGLLSPRRCKGRAKRKALKGPRPASPRTRSKHMACPAQSPKRSRAPSWRASAPQHGSTSAGHADKRAPTNCTVSAQAHDNGARTRPELTQPWDQLAIPKFFQVHEFETERLSGGLAGTALALPKGSSRACVSATAAGVHGKH